MRPYVMACGACGALRFARTYREGCEMRTSHAKTHDSAFIIVDTTEHFNRVLPHILPNDRKA